MFWEIVFYLMIFAGFLATIANTVILFHLGGLAARLREEQQEFFRDMLEAVGQVETTPPEPLAKTWDQKYEEAVDAFEKRRNRELMDLPPMKADYGEGPAPNPQPGLVIRDR